MSGTIVDRTVDAIEAEIRNSSLKGIAAKTIFFGGGTPTFLHAAQIRRLLNAVFETHPPSTKIEITSEANPGTVDSEKFGAMRQAGFNRISLGAQSFFDEDLVVLGRVHRSGHIERAVNAARDAGFDNVNIDLMFALPGQSLKAWEHNLDRAIALGTDHLSLYGLTLEPNTPFYKQHLKGELVLPEEDTQVRMYDLAVAKTADAGLRQYEISNFAKRGFECEQNLCYWRNEFYAGYGPGAVGFMPGQTEHASSFPDNGCSGREGPGSSPVTRHASPRRYTNLKHPERYCAAVEAGAPVWFEEEFLTPEAVRLERLMLGLRLNDGLNVQGLGLDPVQIRKLEKKDWLKIDDEVATLTPSGRHFCSEVVLTLA